jgi:hypothetical protein
MLCFRLGNAMRMWNTYIHDNFERSAPVFDDDNEAPNLGRKSPCFLEVLWSMQKLQNFIAVFPVKLKKFNAEKENYNQTFIDQSNHCTIFLSIFGCLSRAKKWLSKLGIDWKNFARSNRLGMYMRIISFAPLSILSLWMFVVFQGFVLIFYFFIF